MGIKLPVAFLSSYTCNGICATYLGIPLQDVVEYVPNISRYGIPATGYVQYLYYL